MKVKIPARGKRGAVRSVGVGSLMLAGYAVLNGGANAQTPPSPSQIPPGATAGETSTPATLALPAPQGLQAPENAEKINLIVGSFEVEGAFGNVTAPAPAAGASITVADIYRYAANLQQAYLDAGYPLVRVVVPAQDLDASGRVRIRVVSGAVERIDVSNVPAHVRQRISDVLAPLVSRPNIKREEIERRLLLAGDTAGVSLSSALSSGSRAGGTILVVSGDYDAVDGVLSFDNSISEELGRYQVTASAALNSAFGVGDRLILTLAGPGDDTLFDSERTREYVGLSAEVPIGIDGLTLSLGGVYAKSQPAGAVAAQRLESEFSRASVSLSYPLVRTRESTHRIALSVDRAEERQVTNIVSPAAILSLDSTTVIRGSLSGQTRFKDGAAVGYSIELSRGIDALGARGSSDATVLKPLSRAGADAEFTKLDVSGQLLMPVGSFNFTTLARYTTGFGDPLLRSEQTAVVAPNFVSGPPSGNLAGDDTVSARIEVDHPFPTALGLMTPYAFGAIGKITLQQPSALEVANERATSVGVGLRAAVPVGERNSISARLEWAMVETERQPLDRYWLSGSVALRF